MRLHSPPFHIAPACVVLTLCGVTMCNSSRDQPGPPSQSASQDEQREPPTVAPGADVLSKHVALLLAPRGDASAPPLPQGSNLRYRSTNGRIAIVAAPQSTLRGVGPDWRLAAVFGTNAEFRKILNAQRLVEAAQAGDKPVLSGYITLDKKRAPASDDAILSALRQTGADPQTVSGNIVTARIPITSAGALAALHWVHSIELSGKVAPR
jgi:hypothetical protein